MSIPKKDRFGKTPVKMVVNTSEFPLKEITIDGKSLFYLGQSNYNDLIDEMIDETAASFQYCYSDYKGNLFEICLKKVIDEDVVFVESIRTRQKE